VVSLPSTDTRSATLIQDLDNAVKYYRSRAFAESTKHSYLSHLRSYIKYCEDTGESQLPMSSQALCRYAVYLAQRLHYASISKYLNVLRILHLDLNMDNPLKDNWFLNTVLKGIRRDNPRSPRRKLPITPDVLLSIKRILDMDKPVDIMFWAACSVAFFGFFRKSNLFSRSRLDMGQCFVRGTTCLLAVSPIVPGLGTL
jgi:hypothetical protein